MVIKIMSAVKNEEIEGKLEESYKEVIGNFNNQEDLFNMINKNLCNILVLSEELPGYYSKYALIKKIKELKKKIKVIVILKAEDIIFEQYLQDNAIEFVIYDKKTYFEEIKLKINNYKDESEKNIFLKNKNNGEEDKNALITLNTQNVFAVAGNTGCGKSMFTYLYSTYLAKKGLEVLVIDFDTEKGDLNLFYNLPSKPKNPDYNLPKDKNTSINYLADMIDKGTFCEYNFENCLIKKRGMNNLKIISGNTSLNICLNTLSSIYYSKILEAAKLKFDVIFLDISSSLFLDSTQFSICNASDIFFLMEPNRLSIERARRTLNEITENWNIEKEKLKIVVNKYRHISVEKDLIKELLKQYEVIGFLPFNEDLERVFIDALSEIPKNIKDELEYISEKMGLVRTKNLVDKMFIK